MKYCLISLMDEVFCYCIVQYLRYYLYLFFVQYDNYYKNVLDEFNFNYILFFILQEEPFIMFKKPKYGESLAGNDRFEGYCKDLTTLLADKIGVKCK